MVYEYPELFFWPSDEYGLEYVCRRHLHLNPPFLSLSDASLRRLLVVSVPQSCYDVSLLLGERCEFGIVTPQIRRDVAIAVVTGWSQDGYPTHPKSDACLCKRAIFL